MKTSSCKQKGRKLQQLMRDLIISYSAGELTADDVRSISMGASGCDILLSSKGKKVFPYSIECKNTEKLNVWRAWEQCVSNIEPNTDPLLFIKKNRQKTLAVIDAEFLIKILIERNL